MPNEDGSRLYTTANSALLEEAAQFFTVTMEDGRIAQAELNLPPEVDYKNPYRFDLSQFIPNLQCLTLDRFFDLSQRLVTDACERSGQPLVPLSEEYPPDDFASFGDELITYQIISREPANMSADGTSRPQRGHRQSYSARDPRVGDNIIEVHERPLDHEIEFTCWAKSNKLANYRAVWLENLFTAHKWVFTSNGASRFHFIRRLSDGYQTSGSQRLFSRPLRFFLRFSEFLSKANYEIKNVEVVMQLVPNT